MCKILLVDGFDQSKQKENWKFVIEMGRSMSKGNTHGLGYAAINSKQELYGERWLYNNEAFSIRHQSKQDRKIASGILRKFKDIINYDLMYRKYNNFGLLNIDLKAIMLHTRLATCDKVLKNVHPFVDNQTGTALIHNGKINNSTFQDNIRSTCDSERILNQYLLHNVSLDPTNMTYVCNELCGEMACGIFGKDINGYYLDIWRSCKNNLYGSYIRGLGITVFTTDIDDIRSVCKKLNYNSVCAFQIKENVLLRLNALSGEIKQTETFTGIKSYYSKGFCLEKNYWNTV